MDHISKKLESVQNALDILESESLSSIIAKEMAFKWMPELIAELRELQVQKAMLIEENIRLSEENDELLKWNTRLCMQKERIAD